MQKKVRDLKREMILEEAGKYFDKEGFDRMTMGELAKTCGISVGALYKLFASKEELFYAYVGYQIKLLYEKILANSVTVISPIEKLQIIVEQVFETFCEKSKLILDPVAGDPLFYTKLSVNKKNPAQILHDYTADIFEILAQEHPLAEENMMRLSYLFHHFLLGYIEHWMQFGGDLKKESDKALDRFLKGIYR